MGQRRTRTGTALIFAAAAGFGLNPLFARLLFAEGIGAEAASLYRFALPLLLTLPFLRVGHDERPEAARMVLLGIANAFGILGFFHALETIPAATAILIYYTYPAFNVAVGWLFFGRRPTREALAAAALVVIAASLAVAPEAPTRGEAIAVAAAFIAPLVYAVMIQYLAAPARPMAPARRIAVSVLGHMLVLLPAAMLSGQNPLAPATLAALSTQGVVAILGLGLLAAALPQYLFLLGAPLAGPNRTAIAGAAELAVAIVTGALLMGETVNRLEVTAILLMLVALLLRQDGPEAASPKTYRSPPRPPREAHAPAE